MASFDLNEVSKALEITQTPTQSERGVSFENRNLKLDTVEDAKEIVEAIDKCQRLEYLNLAGNTLGVAASEAVAKALENHPEFRRALWKDLFTGRLKDEIPKSLKYLGEGLVKADARLTELDLSDNAFGPIGVKGLAELLSSPACYNLHHLRLNNNGLGIAGAKLLARALTDCLNKSRAAGTPLKLRTFIAGRNRLENEGATVLAAVFRDMATLEEFAVPQNGIYHVGISALAEALAKNSNLHTINLNDNTVGPRGSAALATALCSLTGLHTLNLGDCLLRNRGALAIAPSLRGLSRLQHLVLDYNEIRADGAEAIVKAVADKTCLQFLGLDGNALGAEGQEQIKSILAQGAPAARQALQPLDGDESADEEEEEIEDEEQEDEEEPDDSDGSCEEPTETKSPQQNGKKLGSVTDFLVCPTAERLLSLGMNAPYTLSNEAEIEGRDEDTPPDVFLNSFLPVLMKVGGLAADPQKEAADAAINCSNHLYKRLFEWANGNEQRSALINNSLLVQFGLIKSEDKKYRPPWNLFGCMAALEEARKQSYFPKETDVCISLFLEREKEFVSNFENQGHDFLSNYHC